MPLVPSVVALTVIDFSDRFFLVRLRISTSSGLYAIGVRIAAALLFVLAAFRTAWPAFAFSIRDDDEAKRVYGVRPDLRHLLLRLGRARRSASGRPGSCGC